MIDFRLTVLSVALAFSSVACSHKKAHAPETNGLVPLMAARSGWRLNDVVYLVSLNRSSGPFQINGKIQIIKGDSCNETPLILKTTEYLQKVHVAAVWNEAAMVACLRSDLNISKAVIEEISHLDLDAAYFGPSNERLGFTYGSLPSPREAGLRAFQVAVGSSSLLMKSGGNTGDIYPLVRAGTLVIKGIAIAKDLLDQELSRVGKYGMLAPVKFERQSALVPVMVDPEDNELASLRSLAKCLKGRLTREFDMPYIMPWDQQLVIIREVIRTIVEGQAEKYRQMEETKTCFP